ncbi:MAG: site-specific integrase [Patescibacteria group bacterium]|nr:site-specific integrase [Patescibacteria group bacterium]
MSKVFRMKGRNVWYYKVKTADGVWQRFTGFTDKRASQAKREQHQAQIDRGEAGLLDRFAPAKKRPLTDHLSDYLAYLSGLGRNHVYIMTTGQRLTKLFDACAWDRISKICPDDFYKWRASQVKMSSTTKNAYLSLIKTFCQWLVNNKRMATNPLAGSARVENRGKLTRVRRALDDQEIRSLLSVSGEYKLVYLLAVTTGLRRNELKALRWPDVHLDVDRPYLLVRASTTKNHKMATIFLKAGAVELLKERRNQCDESDPVLKVPSRHIFYRHLNAAKIKRVDPLGRVIDFHALRHTFITSLSRSGVQPRVAMALARHSQIDLTMKVYTDAGALGDMDGVENLPDWDKPADQQDNQIDNLALSDKESETKGAPKKCKKETKTGSRQVAGCHSLATKNEKSHSLKTPMDIEQNGSFVGNAGERSRTSTSLRILEPEYSEKTPVSLGNSGTFGGVCPNTVPKPGESLQKLFEHAPEHIKKSILLILSGTDSD